MLAENRRDEISELVRKNGAVTTSDMVSRFGVSIETIRRDFLHMEENGILKRVHGGAIAEQKMKRFNPLEERNKEFSREKRELSLNAIRFIEEGDIIAIDTGSTAILFAEVLRDSFSSLTVVTHSLDVFNILCHHKNFKTILCGGHFLREENSFYGSLALDSLRNIHVQKSFIFPSAVSIDFGVCDYNENLFLVQREMTLCAEHIFVLADSSKFEKRALLKVSDMKKEYTYITDSKLAEGLVKLYAENEINVYKGE